MLPDSFVGPSEDRYVSYPELLQISLSGKSININQDPPKSTREGKLLQNLTLQSDHWRKPRKKQWCGRKKR